MDIIEEQQKVYDFINQTIVNNKKISHAYLIEKNGYDNYIFFIKDMIKKILTLDIIDLDLKNKIELEVDSDNYPDIKYIRPDGYWIKKEQLLSLKEEFSKKSMLENKLIYIIDGADKLNESSANTILKFLEEPSDDIIAILISDNRYKVIETIISRCQIISLRENQNIIFEDANINKFYNDLINRKKMILYFEEYYSTIFENRIISKEIIDILEKKLISELNNKNELLLNNNYINYISIFDNAKMKLEFNVNIKLWLNDLIIELMEVM